MELTKMPVYRVLEQRTDTQYQYPQNIIIKSMPKQSTTSATSQNQQELEVAIRALYQSGLVIYANFQLAFHLLGLVILAFLAYKLGKFSVSEAIAQKVKAVEKRIRDVEQERQGLPSRIKSVTSFYFKLIMLFVVLSIAAGGILYSQQITLDIRYSGVLFALCVLLYIMKIIHVSILTSKSKKLPEKQKQITNQVKQINNDLGPKVQNSLKNILCRDKLLSKQQAPSHICTKKQCQEIRQALRAKYEVIKNLAECALQFEWCSTCKQRRPFDELIKFEAKPMPAVRDGDVSEDQDADVKIGYLLETLEEIDKWVQEAGPCNCSKLYMEEILKNRRNTTRQLKQINAKIELHDKQRQPSAVGESKTITKQYPYMQVNVRNKKQ